jgi:hypothetical protein
MTSLPPTVPPSTSGTRAAANPPRRKRQPPRMRHRLAAMIAGVVLPIYPSVGWSWGDEGHEIIALIAEHYLKPQVRSRVQAILDTDPTGLTHGTGMAAEATWADKFRDSDRDTTQNRYLQTRAWHYVNIELTEPRIDVACYRHPTLTKGTPASEGPAQDCIIDKIDQFRAELRSAATASAERRLALQFLLHLVGDIHQPLHAADHYDHGGNDLRVASRGGRPGNLHHEWDTVFVERLGTDAAEVADKLIHEISPEDRHRWSSGTAADWARQSFALARIHAYGKLPRISADPVTGGARELGASYEADAEKTAAMQLQRAGLRLARLLNDDLH